MLSHPQHALNKVQVRRVNKSTFAQMAFTFFRFFSQQVAFKSFISAYFARTCNFESFFSTGVSLHLWHGLKFGNAKVA